ncbi:hypothetical protein [Denitratimonas sp. CY0512]|uniref:hypothetical protein n=1 Tax=Denitratimonas sp. CY0512 TaxID=3131940 RepID=UPI0030A11D50
MKYVMSLLAGVILTVTACSPGASDPYLGMYYNDKSPSFSVVEIVRDGDAYLMQDVLLHPDHTEVRKILLNKKDGHLAYPNSLGGTSFVLSEDKQTLYTSSGNMVRITREEIDAKLKKIEEYQAIASVNEMACNAEKAVYMERVRGISNRGRHDLAMQVLYEEYTDKYEEAAKAIPGCHKDGQPGPEKPVPSRIAKIGNADRPAAPVSTPNSSNSYSRGQGG